MFYITGDTHIPTDIRKLNKDNFPEQSKLTKDDYIIICGDFGGVWSKDNEEDNYWLDKLEAANFTTLFVDGNHENFDLLYSYPIEEWNGGDIRRIRPTVLHLERGQVFSVNNTKFFTFGGGKSIDKVYRAEGISWWPEELPTQEEYFTGKVNLAVHDWEVDYVITHTAPLDIAHLMGFEGIDGDLNEYLVEIKERLKYKEWFFGHYHRDDDMGKNRAIYDRIIKLNEK